MTANQPSDPVLQVDNFVNIQFLANTFKDVEIRKMLIFWDFEKDFLGI